MDSTHVAWKKTVALALALAILGQPALFGVRLVSQVGSTVLASALTVTGDMPPALPKPLTLPEQPIATAAPVGYLPASWDVAPTGAFLYSIPLDVPAGRAGMYPALSLHYSSSGVDGLFGMGWSLSGLSRISRCPKSLSTEGAVSGVRYNASDRFCLDGLKLIAVGDASMPPGVYGGNGTQYRTEQDSFARIVSVLVPGSDVSEGPNQFIVYTKDGRIRTYGMYGKTQVSSGVGWDPSPVEGAHTYMLRRAEWLLERDQDRHGNEIRYEYTWNEHFPARMRYTFHGSDLAGQRQVEFTYENRPDASFFYQAGVRYNLTKRVKSIDLYAPNPAAMQVVWRYTFSYTLGNSGRSLLTSVAKCGPSGSCLKAKTFAWHDPPAVPYFSTTALGTQIVNTSGSRAPYMRVADLDGDGSDDLVYTLGGTNDADSPVYARLGMRNAAGEVSPLSNLRMLTGTGSGFPANATLPDSRPMDLQADGASEFMVRYRDASGLRDKVFRWDRTTNMFVDTGITFSTSSTTDFGDMDGDGRLDYITADVTDGQLWDYSVRLNTGGAFTGPKQSSIFTAGCSARVTDTDGDGRAELVARQQTVAKTCSSIPYVLRLNDNGQPSTEAAATTVDGVLYYRALPPVGGYANRLGDFNGDGLEDVLLVPNKIDPETGTWDRPGVLLWNTGNGLALDAHTITIPHDTFADLRIADVNGDGRDDVVAFHAATTVMISRGDGTFISGDIALDAGTADPDAGRTTSQVGDFNGDGRVDVVRIVNHQMSVLIQQATYGDRLHMVTDEGTNWSREAIIYSNAWTDHPEKMGDSTASYPLMCIRRGLVVARAVASYAHLVDPPELAFAARWIHYAYEDPVTDLRGRGFLGFGMVRVWDPQRPSETITTFAHRQQVDGKFYPSVGRPASVTTVVPILTQTQVGSTPGTVTARVTRTVYTVQTRKLNNDATYFVFGKSSSTREWEQPVSIEWSNLGGSTGSSKTEHITGIVEPTAPLRRTDRTADFDDYGNPTSRTLATTNGVTEQVKIGYDNRVADWLISLPTTRTITRTEPDGDPPAVTRSVEHHYDPLGRLDAVFVEKNNPNPDLRETTTYGYDSYGVLRSVARSAPGLPARETRYEYAPVFIGQPDEEVYPSQIWSQHTSNQYRPSTWLATHLAYGVTVATEDANGVISTARYDEFGRPVERTPAGGATALISFAARLNNGPFGGTNGTVTTTSSASITSKVSTDALGRTIESAVSGFDGSFGITLTRYDRLGRAISLTAPAPQGTTTREYDSLDRLVKTTLPDKNTHTYLHSFASTRAFDPEGFEKRTDYDLDGRVERTIDRWVRMLSPGVSTVDITTTFTYAPFDLVSTVTDHQGHITSMQHDGRGRRIQLNDPNRGTTKTTYYGTGEIATETHLASGNVTTFGYDDLGRKVTSTTKDGTSTFVWDTAAHGIGKMAYAISPDNIRTDLRYDTFGRAAGTDYTGTDRVTYAIDRHYDTAGRLLTLQYPQAGPGGTSRFTLQYDYNTNGYIESIRHAKPGQTLLEALWTVQSRNPNLALDAGTLGSGTGAVTLHRSYHNPTGRLRSILAVGSAGAPLPGFTYEYYKNGLVKSRERSDSTVRQETFRYDSLNRLTDWERTLPGPNSNQEDQVLTTTYTYDPMGNLTGIAASQNGSSTGVETRSYGKSDGSQPHTVTAVASICLPSSIGCLNTTYVYDSEGRQTSGGDRDTVTYTAVDLPKSVTKDGETTTYLYDAFGQRIKEISRTHGTTFYVPGLYEKRTVGRTTTHVFYVQGIDGAAAQVVYDGLITDIQYQLTDQLGSIGAVIDTTGAVKQSLFYDPFGARLNSDSTSFAGDTGDVTHGYTGHEHDDHLSLINMKGRVYDPTLKRFLSPDPVVADIGDSQSWNPYSYVNNSPLNYTDPTGSMPCGPRPPYQTAPEDCTNLSGKGVNNKGAQAQGAWLGIGSSTWMGSNTSKLWAEANKRAAASDSTAYSPGTGDSGTGTVYEGQLAGSTSEKTVFDQDSRTILIVQDGRVVAVCNSGGCVPNSQTSYAPGSSQPISGAETTSTDPSGSVIGYDQGIAAQGQADPGTITIVVGSPSTGMLGGALVQNRQQESMVFGAGQYIPQPPSGRGLIAHELTHVVQQGPTVQQHVAP